MNETVVRVLWTQQTSLPTSIGKKFKRVASVFRLVIEQQRRIHIASYITITLDSNINIAE